MPDRPPVFGPATFRRVGARPSTLDTLVRPHLRLAPDEALVRGAEPVEVADDHAIDVRDGGWQQADLSEVQALEVVATMTDWPVDSTRPQLLQGLAAGVPIKILLPGDGTATVVVASAYVHELRRRWR